MVLLVWFLVTEFGVVLPIFLPRPGDTFSALWNLLVSGRFFIALLYSFARISISTVLAVLVGSVVGVSMGLSKTIEHILNPIVLPLRYLPITALIPLLVLWFGIGEPMKITFLFMGIIFYFIPLVKNAIHSVPSEYVDAAKTFGANFPFMIRNVYLPYAMPQIFDGLIVINGIGWTYVILAEIINAKEGLGYLINIASRLQRSDEVFAGLILISFVAIGSDKILRTIRDRYFFW